MSPRTAHGRDRGEVREDQPRRLGSSPRSPQRFAGSSHGVTDDCSDVTAIDGKVRSVDWHATVLHLPGLDHEKLTYRHAGRNFRLTDVAGNVVTEITG